MPNNSKESPYPTFSPVSTLFDRCKQDINQFRKLETPNNSSLVPDITFNVEGKPLRVIKEMLQLKVLNPMNKSTVRSITKTTSKTKRMTWSLYIRLTLREVSRGNKMI